MEIMKFFLRMSEEYYMIIQTEVREAYLRIN
jgi:hypothetical protein